MLVCCFFSLLLYSPHPSLLPTIDADGKGIGKVGREGRSGERGKEGGSGAGRGEKLTEAKLTLTPTPRLGTRLHKRRLRWHLRPLPQC